MLLALGRSRLILQFFDSIQVGNSSLAILTTTTWLTHAKPLQDDSTYTTGHFWDFDLRCSLVCDATRVTRIPYAHTVPYPQPGPAHTTREGEHDAQHATQHNGTRLPRRTYGTVQPYSMAHDDTTRCTHGTPCPTATRIHLEHDTQHATQHNATRPPRRTYSMAHDDTTRCTHGTPCPTRLRLVLYTCADSVSRGHLPPLISSGLRAYKLDAERDVNGRLSGWGWTGRAPFGIRQHLQQWPLLQARPCCQRTPTGNCEQGADSSTSVRRACGVRILCQVAARPRGGLVEVVQRFGTWCARTMDLARCQRACWGGKGARG
jgi:hypothetical protein